MEESSLKNKHKNSQFLFTQKTYRWLIWLAIYMQKESKSEFLIERISPPKLVETSISKISIAIFLILVGLSTFEFLKQGIDFRSAIIIGGINAVWGGYPIFVVIYLTIHGLLNKDIKIAESLIWSWRKAKQGFHEKLTNLQFIIVCTFGGSVVTYICGTSSIHIFTLITLLIFQIRGDYERHRLFPITLGASIIALILSIEIFLRVILIILTFRSTFGLINMFVHGLNSSEIEVKTFPNQGIWMSAKNAISFFLLIALNGGLLGGLLGLMDSRIVIPLLGVHFEGILQGFISGLIIGLSTGLLFGFQYDGIACIQHGIARITFYSKGCIPWNYARFLNYCTERSLLQRVGGRYQFIHRLLQEHFAAMPFEK